MPRTASTTALASWSMASRWPGRYVDPAQSLDTSSAAARCSSASWLGLRFGVGLGLGPVRWCWRPSAVCL